MTCRVVPGRSVFLQLCLSACALCLVIGAQGAGVTVITHGFGGNVTGWVSNMCYQVTRYRTFPGTNFSLYKISITQPSAGVYATSQALIRGVAPDSSDSGEILVALDWSTISTGTVPTTDMAAQAAAALLSTNLIPDLHGHALAELPLHLVGHSRGGSVVTEMARFLGASGVWLDQVTTLDPHPVSGFGDPATVSVYANVLFADNYWQNLGDNLFVPNGAPVSGSYNRQLTNLSGGDISSHTDVHLWYHGTIDLRTPASDGSVSVTEAERTNWWTALELRGTNSGFLYSLIGGGNRFSMLEPAGAGKGRIVDGYNKQWDLGAGTAGNRTPLPANDGSWPNLISFGLIGTNPVTVGQPILAAAYIQFGSNTSATAQLRLYLDADLNAFNSNAVEVASATIAGTGPASVAYTPVSIVADPLLTPPGTYRLLAKIACGSRSRWSYAPDPVTLVSGMNNPVLLSEHTGAGQFKFTVSAQPWQKVAIEASTDLVAWTPIQTNVFLTNFVFTEPLSMPVRFYRAALR